MGQGKDNRRCGLSGLGWFRALCRRGANLMAVWSGMPDAAVKFRGKVFQAEYHLDALKDCIQCEEWPESHEEIERIIDEEIEPIEFGRMNGLLGTYRPLDGMDAQVRREWYLFDR